MVPRWKWAGGWGWLDFLQFSLETPLKSTKGPLKGLGVPLPFAAPPALLKESSRKAPPAWDPPAAGLHLGKGWWAGQASESQGVLGEMEGLFRDTELPAVIKTYPP